MKRIIIVLATTIFFGISASAKCWENLGFHKNWDGNGNNYVQIKNICGDAYIFTIWYGGQHSSIKLYPGQTYEFNIGTSVGYNITEEIN